jgi:hypothetical protein
MVVARENNHPLTNSDNNISREDIDEIMAEFLPKIRDLPKKISFTEESIKQKSSDILEYNM